MNYLERARDRLADVSYEETWTGVVVGDAQAAALIAIAEQLQGINAKLERALQMANSIVSYGDLAVCPPLVCPRCGSPDWPHECQPQPPPEPCPRCEEQGHNCICDTVPGQP